MDIELINLLKGKAKTGKVVLECAEVVDWSRHRFDGGALFLRVEVMSEDNQLTSIYAEGRMARNLEGTICKANKIYATGNPVANGRGMKLVGYRVKEMVSTLH